MPARVPRVRRRLIGEDSQDEGPGPNQLGCVLAERASSHGVCCGRFAAFVEDDTESIANNSLDECAEEATTQEVPGVTTPQQDGEDVYASRGVHEPVTCAPTQIEPDSHEERLARVQQLVRHP